MSARAVIACVWVAGLVAFASIAGVARWHFFAHQVPPANYKGIGIRYLEGARQPWPGLLSAIDVIEDKTRDRYAERAPDLLKNLWIEVVPYDGFAKSQYMPDGLIPIELDGAIRKVRANGTIRTERPVLGPTFLVLVVRQLRDDDTKEQSWAATGTSSISSVVHSALFHEFGEHAVSLRLYGNPNSNHASAELDAFTHGLEKSFAGEAAAE